jgi:hypothetical protein
LRALPHIDAGFLLAASRSLGADRPETVKIPLLFNELFFAFRLQSDNEAVVIADFRADCSGGKRVQASLHLNSMQGRAPLPKEEGCLCRITVSGWIDTPSMAASSRPLIKASL